jgi:hypothetical protein
MGTYCESMFEPIATLSLVKRLLIGSVYKVLSSLYKYSIDKILKQVYFVDGKNASALYICMSQAEKIQLSKKQKNYKN